MMKLQTNVPMSAWAKKKPNYRNKITIVRERLNPISWTLQEIRLFLIVLGIFPAKGENLKFALDCFGLLLFTTSNTFFLYCYTDYVYNCQPLDENITTNGANIYSACLTISSFMIFLPLWFRRAQLVSIVESVAEVKLTRMEKLFVASFHLLTITNAFLYASVLLPWYVDSMDKCGAERWLNLFLVTSILWNMLILCMPIFLVLSFSYINRIRFRNLNYSLKQYISSGGENNNKKCNNKSIKGIREEYKYLRLKQNEVEAVVNVALLGNHLFILVSLINTMLYLVVSLMERQDNISYSIGVTGSLLGILVIFITASFVELEAKEIRQPREIILQSEKFLKLHTDEGKELNNLMKQTEVKYRMEPGGLYVLDRKFTLKILGAASTYLVISIQFYLTEEQGELPEPAILEMTNYTSLI